MLGVFKQLYDTYPAQLFHNKLLIVKQVPKDIALASLLASLSHLNLRGIFSSIASYQCTYLYIMIKKEPLLHLSHTNL